MLTKTSINKVLCFLICCVIVEFCLIYKQHSTIISADHTSIALCDSVNYYKSKYGEEVAKKMIIETDMKFLSKEIEAMKLKKPDTIIKYTTKTEFLPSDTVFILVDSIESYTFDFDNDYRKLSGIVTANSGNISLSITNDIVFADYTLAVENGYVYIKSDNPYIKCTNITGYALPKKKKWSFGIGPSIGLGYDFDNHKVVPYIGVGINATMSLTK